MRFQAVVASLALVAGAWSCTEKNPPKEQSGAISSAGASAQSSKSSQAKPAQASAYPKGAQWTILCREFTGPNHVSVARQYKENLMKTPGMRDWHILHKENQSLLYYGYYKTYNDPKAKADRKVIDAMADAQGRRPFRLAVISPLDNVDVGPPEWNLANAKGFWSLQIGAYQGSPERKQAAVDAVKAARAQGIEAYYFHGDTSSIVCIGSWPREAVRLAEESTGGGERGAPKLVIPGLPEGVQTPVVKDKQGQKLHVEAPRNEVVDPSLKAMMQQYPTNAVNGETMITSRTDPRTGRVQTFPDPSFVVPVPRATAGGGSILDGGTTDTAGGIETPVPAQPESPLAPPPATPGGRLKTVGS